MTLSGIFRMKKLTGRGKLLIASKHNKRATQAALGAGRHIDAARMGLNTCLHGPATPEEVQQLAQERMREAGITKLRERAVAGLELLFSLPRDTAVHLEDFFPDCLRWAADNFGGAANLLSADVHHDEAAPHLHVLILPLVNGRMNGSDLFGNRTRLLALQDSFHKAVAGRYGLKRAPARLVGAARANVALAVLTRLRAGNDPAQTSMIWSPIRDAIERDPAPFAENMGIAAIEPPPKPMRTMAAIFTSKGKGGQLQGPIGKGSGPIGEEFSDALRLTLSCVGRRVPVVSPKPCGGEGDDSLPDRVVDRSDCDFTGWDDTSQGHSEAAETGYGAADESIRDSCQTSTRARAHARDGLG